MAVGAWKIYGTALDKIGSGTMALGAGIFKMSLHRSAACANIIVRSTRNTFASIGNEISARGGYVAGGRAITPNAGKWSAGASPVSRRFTYTTLGIVFTASGSSLVNIKFALIRKSAVSVTSGHPLCYASLSSAQFTITSPNTLTILPAATGVFTMA